MVPLTIVLPCSEILPVRTALPGYCPQSVRCITTESRVKLSTVTLHSGVNRGSRSRTARSVRRTRPTYCNAERTSASLAADLRWLCRRWRTSCPRLSQCPGHEDVNWPPRRFAMAASLYSGGKTSRRPGRICTPDHDSIVVEIFNGEIRDLTRWPLPITLSTEKGPCGTVVGALTLSHCHWARRMRLAGW